MKLSEHFSLEEMIKTKTGMSNIPDDKAVANLKNILPAAIAHLKSTKQREA